MNRTYPYKAWVLQPSGKPKEVELVGRMYDYSYPDWDESNTGKGYHVGDLHPTREAAISAGLAALDVQQAKLTKQQERIDKKRATLLAARS